MNECRKIIFISGETHFSSSGTFFSTVLAGWFSEMITTSLLLALPWTSTCRWCHVCTFTLSIFSLLYRFSSTEWNKHCPGIDYANRYFKKKWAALVGFSSNQIIGLHTGTSFYFGWTIWLSLHLDLNFHWIFVIKTMHFWKPYRISSQKNNVFICPKPRWPPSWILQNDCHEKCFHQYLSS